MNTIQAYAMNRADKHAPNVAKLPEWKFEIGARIIPILNSGLPNVERAILQRMIDADSGQRYYRFTHGRSGTALDSAFHVESYFEAVPPFKRTR